MSDIVSELNRYAKLTDLEAADIMEEAAAEILRLRAENEKLREENEKLVAQSWVVDGALLSEREEIAKLRAALNHIGRLADIATMDGNDE